MSIFKELDQNMSLIEMKRILEENSRTATSLKKRIETLDANAKKSASFDIDYDLDVKSDDMSDDIDDEVEDEEEEFYYYFSNIKDALKECKNIEEVKQAIYDNLPLTENKNYCNIVRRIILELVREKKEYIKNFEGEDPSVLEEVKQELDQLDFYINVVRNHRKIEKEEFNTKQSVSNNIVFLTTMSGNIYAEQDLASIDSEFYPGFKELIQSIENGTFKNVKRFSASHNSFKSISEVKDFKIRVVFDRIGKNTYIILDIFVKKNQAAMGYQDQVSHRLDYYKRNEEYFKALFSTPESIESHKEVLANIYKGLDEKNIVKTKKSGE